MIALQITSMKNFMNHLLVADTFDPFLLEEATVSTALTVTIDGHINKDFYPADERGEDCIPWDLQSWSKIKGLCFDLIKGKHTPLYFKFVLHMQPDKAAAMLTKAQVDPDVIRALVLNIRYDGEKNGSHHRVRLPDLHHGQKCRHRMGQGIKKISGSEGYLLRRTLIPLSGVSPVLRIIHRSGS